MNKAMLPSKVELPSFVNFYAEVNQILIGITIGQ